MNPIEVGMQGYFLENRRIFWKKAELWLSVTDWRGLKIFTV